MHYIYTYIYDVAIKIAISLEAISLNCWEKQTRGKYVKSRLLFKKDRALHMHTHSCTHTNICLYVFKTKGLTMTF